MPKFSSVADIRSWLNTPFLAQTNYLNVLSAQHPWVIFKEAKTRPEQIFIAFTDE
jgi:hypothetical protein